LVADEYGDRIMTGPQLIRRPRESNPALKRY
jgi:hypothetical protein